MNKEKLIEIKVSEIFDNSQYIVPIYQRNYAWGEDEIKQLIEDINDANNEKYYLGTLIVNKQKDGAYEVIDGQQRLTTLYLIKKYLDEDFDPNANKLQFEAREKYKRTFQLKDLSNEDSNNKYYADEIIKGYKSITDNFKSKEKEDFKEEFKKKLENVYLVRVQVPENIDLNHYFEIMNTRGEQLESHEIIKAKILRVLEEQEDKIVAAEIWEKCSDMNTYIQMKFDNDKNNKLRKSLFGEDWNKFAFENFEGIKQAILGTATNGNTEQELSIKDFIAQIVKLEKDDELIDFFENNPLSYETIEEILSNEFKNKDKFIKQVKLKNNARLEDVINFAKILPKYPQLNKSSKKQEEDIEKERFESIINFPNFLLQVNALINKNIDADNEGFLDDKKFLDLMKKNYEDENRNQDTIKAKNFIYNLLKYRFLFDKYILKRDYSKNKNEGEWSLKKIKVYNEGTDFNYINTFDENKNSQDENEEETDLNKQLKMLQATLRITYTSPKTMKWIAVLLEYVNKNIQQLNCADLIKELENYCRETIKQNIYDEKGEYNVNDAYHSMDRIVFSYLDYLLYRDGYSTEYKNEKIIIAPYPADWKCVYRNSIEHFSPQTGGHFESAPDILHSFGNLALITVSGNSKFSNMTPNQKIDKENEHIINQSLKLKIMKELTSKNGGIWTKELMEQHQEKMLEILEKDIRT